MSIQQLRQINAALVVGGLMIGALLPSINMPKELNDAVLVLLASALVGLIAPYRRVRDGGMISTRGGR